MIKSALFLAAALAPSLALAQATPGGAPIAPSFDVAAARARIDANVDKNYPQLDALYKDIHAHPELGFQENRTAALLAAKMRKLGFTVTEHVGKTGIVAIYKNGPGKTMLIRTELDALPMEEKTGLPWASHAQQTLDGKQTYVAHSCGHDIHMAWWVGTAEALLAMKDQWHGTLMFIGQPSEETVGGAKAMLADGLFTRWSRPDYGFAAHVTPAPTGTVTVKEGPLTAASDEIDITFHGRGAHGAMPDKSIDPIVMGAHFVSDVQSVISREKAPGTFGVVTVGAFQAGTVDNIIPDHADLKLTLRSHDDKTRKLLIDGVTRTARAVAAMAGAPVPTIDHPSGANAVHNDIGLADRAAGVLQAALGKDASFVPASTPGIEASEDFSEFIAAGVPSVFFWIGGDDPAMLAKYKAEGKPVPVNHSPYFAPVPDPTIKRGVETLTLSVLMVAGTASK
ncbi:MAG TPA: amidohydrolase [Rhodanobacter sp.]|nr:amidohydrolase [Rhodanobacter sp.]